MKRVFVSLFSVLFFFVIIASPLNAAGKSSKVQLKLSNGASYYGEVNNGKPHGKGTMKWSENKSYSGDWVNGKRSGQGKYVNLSKTLNPVDGPDRYDTERLVYIGEWNNDQQNGSGTLMIEGSVLPRDYYYSISKGTFKNNQFINGYSYDHSHYNEHNFKYIDGSKMILVSISRDSFGGGFSDYLEDYYFNTATINYKYKDAKGNNKEKVYRLSFDSEADLTVYTYANGTLLEEYEPSGEIEVGETYSEIGKLLKPHAKSFDNIYKEIHQWMVK